MQFKPCCTGVNLYFGSMIGNQGYRELYELYTDVLLCGVSAPKPSISQGSPVLSNIPLFNKKKIRKTGKEIRICNCYIFNTLNDCYYKPYLQG